MTPSDRALFGALAADQLVALTAYLEARNQRSEGIQLVCSIIKNRHDLWKRTYAQVCLAAQKGRFEFQCFDAEAALACDIAAHWESRLASDKALTLCFAVSQSTIEGSIPSNVGPSTFYERFDCASPWFQRQIKAGKLYEYCQIGDHVAYAEARFLTAPRIAVLKARAKEEKTS